MHWANAVLLGIVEGLTEFLPVSSTGHLILAARLLGLPQTEFMKTFEIAIQLGTLLAVVLIYWRRLLTDMETMKRVLAAFLPTAVIGVLLYSFIKKFLFAGPSAVLWSLLLGGLALIVFDHWHREGENSVRRINDIPFSKAVGVGCVQSLAVVPGVSRAAATIVGGLWLGLDKKTAVELSFLLAIPTLAAATALDMMVQAPVLGAQEWKFLLIGALASFIVGILSIRFFLSFIQKRGFTAFGVYRIAVAILFWIFVK